jgi:Mg-chelatase subunit ChlD
MSITIDDIRRALLKRGDVSILQGVLKKSLKNPPLKALETNPAALIRPLNAQLADVVDGWIDGTAVPKRKAKPKVKLSVRPLIPYGRNVGRFIEETIETYKPDVVLLDTPLVTGLGAGNFHAFSLHNMLGLPLQVRTLSPEGTIFAKDTFFSGGLVESTIIKCYLERIPLIPIGIPARKIPSRTEQAFQQFLEEIYQDYDRILDKSSSVDEIEDLGHRLVTQMGRSGSSLLNEEREYIIDDCCYLASRVAELSTLLKQGSRVLVLVEIHHFGDLDPLIKTLSTGNVYWEEFYQPPLGIRRPFHYGAAEETVEGLWEDVQERRPVSTLCQRTFSRGLQKWITNITEEPLTLPVADHLITHILDATRHHPEIEQGASVRGALALREVAQGYAYLGKRLNRSALFQASMVALPHRVRMNPGSEKEPVSVIKEISQEILYGLSYQPQEDHQKKAKPLPLTRENLKQALEGLTDVALKQGMKEEMSFNAQDWSLAQEVMNHPLVQEALRNANYPAENQEALGQLLEDLEKEGMLQHLTPDQYGMTEKGKQDLMERLKEMLDRGEISPETLEEMMHQLQNLPTTPSGLFQDLPQEKMSQFLAELMDAQHQGRSSNTSLEDIYVHYTLGEKKGVKTDSEKLDYQKLQIMIHRLEEQGLLRVTGTRTKQYTLTARALSRLLEELIPKSSSSSLTKHAFRKQHEIEKADVRRYKIGDVYRDISLRHTLKEMIKHGKTLKDIGRREFRSFDKKPIAQLDIALCVDVSASMKEQSKLRYAKIALAGLAKAAVEKGDRVGIVAFSNVGNVVTPLTDDYRTIMGSVIQLRADQYTNIGNGLLRARTMLLHDNSGNKKHIILITDGQPNAALAGALQGEDTTGHTEIKMEPQISEGESRGQGLVTSYKGKDWKAKEQLGTKHAIVEARKTRDKDIKISVLLITHQDELGEWTANKIAQIGRGKYHRVTTVENMPLNALQMFQ